MRVVKSQLLAFAGLIMLGVIAASLLNGTITLQAAALRAGIGAAALALADRIVVPLARLLTSAPAKSESTEGPQQPPR